MREFRQLSIDAVHESPENPRRTFTPDTLDELAESIRRRGVLKPILVRANGEGFTLIDGARRLRAAQLAGCTDIPVRVRDIDDATAAEEMIIANLHHEDVPPLEEADGYQRLLAAGRTIDELAARLGKPKRYLYERVSLTRLIPQARDLVTRDILPLNYALKLVSVPAERQPEGLAQCFRPLFRDEPSREQLEPLCELTTWIEKTVRLDPRSEDTNVLLPALAEQVTSAEQERQASVLALSTLHFHTDRTDPKPILVKSWKPADGKDRCRHARPGVIVLGEGQGTFLQVCIAKKECRKHWGRTEEPQSASDTASTDETDVREQQQAALKRQQMEAERWRDELRPRALRLIAEKSATLPWSRSLMALVMGEIQSDDDLFAELVGRLDRLPARRYPQAMAVSLAIRHSWNREGLIRTAKRLGINVTTKALNDAGPVEGTSEEPSAPSKRTRNSHARR